jgi:hypothetical protein
LVKLGSMDISMDPVSQTQEGDTMRSDEKSHKNMSGTRKDGKSKTSNSAPKDLSTAVNQRPVEVDEDATTGISFLIDYSLVAGELRGKIARRLTHKHEKYPGKPEEFSGNGETTIIQFMKRYLSRLEKNAGKVPDEEAQQPGKVRITQPSEAHKPGLDVVPEGSAQPSDILKQGQTFLLRWTFEPYSPSGITGEQLHYRIAVCGKNLERGERIHIGEGEGKIDFSGALTALVGSRPLPQGTYIVEADAEFSLKSMKSDRQSLCRKSRLIQVV